MNVESLSRLKNINTQNFLFCNFLTQNGHLLKTLLNNPIFLLFPKFLESFFSRESDSTFTNVVRPSVCLFVIKTLNSLKSSSFIILHHSSSFFIHLSFILRLLSFSACFQFIDVSTFNLLFTCSKNVCPTCFCQNITYILLGACTLCNSGGDCVTGRKSIWNSAGKSDQRIETYLRIKNPEMFSLLKVCFKNLFTPEGENSVDDYHFLHPLKSYMLHYK